MKFIIKLAIFFGLVYLFIHTVLEQPIYEIAQENYSLQEPINFFTEGFEKIDNWNELFPRNHSRWQEILFQDNERSLHRSILFCLQAISSCQKNSETQNSIRLSENIKKSGRYSVRFHSNAFEPKFLGGSKAALRKQLFDFKENDEIYFSGWFYLEDNGAEFSPQQKLTLLAFRSPVKNLRYTGEPGRNLFITNQNIIKSDLDNWLPKPEIFKSDLLESQPIPQDEWFNLKVKIKLSSNYSGEMQVWINEREVLNEKGQTLPEKEAIYSILEIGILENTNENSAQTLYVDDIWISDNGFPN